MNKQFLLIFDNLTQFLKIISQYKIVHIFMDESVNSQMQNKILRLISSKTKIIKTVIAPCYATQKFADSVVYKSEEFVIGFGKLHLQSFVKYYSYANNVDYALIPVKEIAEYSFCKYAFLKDKKFCFYVCEKPLCALIIKEFFSDDDIYKLEKILSYKNIVLYEKEFEKLVLKQNVYNHEKIVKSINICDGSYKSVIKLYSAISMILQNNKTSEFLGAEYIVLSLLCTNKQDITTNLINSTNLLARFYECMNKFDLIRLFPNTNRHLYLLKKHYNLGLLQNKDYFINCPDNKEMKRVEYTLKAYLPHLRILFNNQKSSFMFSKIEFVSKDLELALALCASVSSRMSILKFARDFGYFENLLK